MLGFRQQNTVSDSLIQSLFCVGLSTLFDYLELIYNVCVAEIFAILAKETGAPYEHPPPLHLLLHMCHG